MPRNMTTDLRLLDRAQQATGLSRRRFAEEVLLREVSTLRRYRSGESKVPAKLRVRLTAIAQGKVCRCCKGLGIPPGPLSRKEDV